MAMVLKPRLSFAHRGSSRTRVDKRVLVSSAQHNGVPLRQQEIFEDRLSANHASRDHAFAWFFLAQLLFAVFHVLVWSPLTGRSAMNHRLSELAEVLIIGLTLTIPMGLLAWRRPGATLTRVVAVAGQMVWSGLIIHLADGAAEAHFHLLGSLAFVAFYRDTHLLGLALFVAVIVRVVHAFLWPEVLYGDATGIWWQNLEVAFWTVFVFGILAAGVRESRRELLADAHRQAELEFFMGTVERRVDERTRELIQSREQYRQLVETTRTVPWELDTSSLTLTYVGPQIEKVLGFTAAFCLVPQFLERHIHPDDLGQVLDSLDRMRSEKGATIEARMRHADGRWLWVRLIASGSRPSVSLRSGTSTEGVVRGVIFDVTDERRLEVELRQSQKLESVGRLASGVAHEINTPIQFVSDSVHFVRDAVSDLAAFVESHRPLVDLIGEGEQSEVARMVAELREDLDVDYLIENVPKALDRALDGLERVASIVRSMRQFAHPDQSEMSGVDLNRNLESTLIISKNEYKYVATVETELGDLPPVLCFGGDLNQVFLNLIVNAAHAIEAKVRGTTAKGIIRICTRQDGPDVVVSVEDTGSGIPETIRDRIFEPFFTTKEVGRGTGQGLAIARSTVVDKHGGSLGFETTVGVGTTFTIRLPVAGPGDSGRRTPLGLAA